jgi:serine protease Do
MDQLVTRGRMTCGHLGVAVQELTPTLARGLGLSDMRGLVVADVSPDGPAANSGLRRGDVITAIDGKPVEDVGHFRNLIASAPPGTKARLTIVCDGREQTVDVTIGAAPERTTAAPGARQESPESRSFRCRRDAGAAVTTGSAARAPKASWSLRSCRAAPPPRRESVRGTSSRK